jgi:hypothetical protein
MRKLIVSGIIVLIVAIGLIFFLVSKGEDMDYEKVPLKTFSDLTREQLDKVAGKRIYFGHQSVGQGMMIGLEELMRAHQSLKLNIVEASNLKDYEGPVFAHSRIGRNSAPNSKVDDFVKFIENGLKDQVDIAFFKYCYADITRNRNIHQMFSYYMKAMKRLKETYPDITFIHCTVPYYRKSGGIKGFIKRFLNRDHNVKREQFNQLMRLEYKPGELFDLAKFESTYADGTRESGDKSRFALVPAYTDDGGHLNPRGREVIVVQWLDFLSSL